MHSDGPTSEYSSVDQHGSQCLFNHLIVSETLQSTWMVVDLFGNSFATETKLKRIQINLCDMAYRNGRMLALHGWMQHTPYHFLTLLYSLGVSAKQRLNFLLVSSKLQPVSKFQHELEHFGQVQVNFSYDTQAKSRMSQSSGPTRVMG